MAIFSLIGSAIAGALFAGSTLAATIIGGALAFAAQLGIQYLNRPKKQKYTAVQGELQYGGDVPVGAVFGTSLVAGQRVGYFKYGSGNQVNADVFALANGWYDGLEPIVYFYGQKFNLVTRDLIGGEAAHYGIEDFGDLVSIRFYDGRPGQIADAKLVNDTGALGQTWKSTSAGTGVCYVIVERTYDGDKFGKGRPDFQWVLKGIKEYDPRKDSTIAGGSGPQRINDVSTWVATKNPAIHRLNYQLGLRGLISQRTLVGEGKSMGQLDLDTYFVAMNVCDTLRVSGKPTYECSLFVDGGMDHTEILKEFDDAMAGYGLNRRGLSGVIPGAPQIPVLEIGPADMPVDRAKDFQFRKSAFDRYNHIGGQFTSIEAMWKPESLTPVYVNADIAEDGRPRQTSNDFLQVTDPDIAQYLLNIRYRQNRKGGTATIPVSRRVGFRVQEGEWVVWNGREWMINEWAIDEKFCITLKLVETGADIYDDEDIEPGPIVIPPTAPINPSLLSTVQNFNVEAGFKTGAEGFDVPTLRFTWDPPNDPTIVAVRFQYKIEGRTETFEDQCPNAESGEYFTTKNVVSGVTYVARATITTVPDRLKTWTPWKTTAQATGMLSLLTALKNIGEDVRSRFTELQAEQDRFWLRMEEIATAFSLEGGVGQVERSAIRAEVGRAFAEISIEQRVRILNDEALAQSVTTISAGLSDALAKIVVEQTARATADSALASSITSLSATVGDVNARVATEEIARANGDGALSSSITGVASDFNGRFASGLVQFQAVSAPGGVDARFAVLLRTGTSSAWKESGFYIEIYTVGGVQRSRMAVSVDQFVIDNGGNKTYPFVFEGGKLKLALADIVELTSGVINIGNTRIDTNGIRVYV